MLRRIFVTCLCLVLASLSQAQNFKNISLNVEEFKLENGLTVYLVPDTLYDEMFGVVITKAGGKDDPATATGLAHYMEHMLFKGTEEIGTTNWQTEKPYIDKIFALYDSLGNTTDPERRQEIQNAINEESVKANEYTIPNELSNIIKGMGGHYLNAGTGPDVTMFYNAFPPNQVEKWIELYSHRFMHPVFRSFQAELEVVYEEKNQYADMFQFALLEEYQKQFFKNHPYGQQPLIGTIEHLKNPSLTKMYEFFQTWYVANNMALILAGNFDPEKVKPLIIEKFGRWRSGTLPERPQFREEPFQGREYFEKKLSPIKLVLLGFRTVPQGHKDEIPLDVCNKILSNSSQTGLLDKLMLDNKLLAALAMPLPYNDLGGEVFLIVPKIAGQKPEEAEKLVMDEISKLKAGEFDTTVLEAAKKQLYVERQRSLEDLMSKALLVAEAFGRGQDVNRYVSDVSRYLQISKQDIVDMANKYYGDNYLAFYSKMGVPKKEKIEKPDYKPVVAKNNVESAYAKKLKEIETPSLNPRIIDFNKAVDVRKPVKGVVLNVNPNPLNDVFTFTIRWGIGEEKNSLLGYAASLLDYAGTKDLSPSEFKKEMSLLGATYQFYSDDSYLTLSVEGIESDLPKVLALLNGLVRNPVVDKDKVSVLYDNEKANRKVERSEPAGVADALYNYVLYNDKSDYLDRMTLKEIKGLDAQILMDTFRYATGFEAIIDYCGQWDAGKLASTFSEYFHFAKNPLSSESPVYREINMYPENKVYFVNKKKALQSKIFFLANGKKYKGGTDAALPAFNLYFSGDFSGLVLQEIREYRSMAYSAGAKYLTPPQPGENEFFYGYIATQADKTNDAIAIFDSLVRTMPEKPERMAMIRDYLINVLPAARPGFRNISRWIERARRKGNDHDDILELLHAYKQLDFEDIQGFYKKNLKNKPMVIMIAGNKKKIDLKELEKYGEVIEIKEKSLFSK